MLPPPRDPLNEAPAKPAITNWSAECYEYIWPMDSRFSLVLNIYQDGRVTAFVLIREEPDTE